MIYCLSCKKPTKDVNVKPKVTKNKQVLEPYSSFFRLYLVKLKVVVQLKSQQ